MPAPEVFLQPNRTAMEAHCRSLAKPVSLGKGRVLGRMLGKYPFYCDPEDTALTPNLLLDGYWEMWLSVALARLIQPGWHVADVGANVGYYTVLFADLVGKTGQVVALEPGNRPRQLLEANVRVNGFASRTRISPVAAGAEEGQGTLHWLPDDTGCATLGQERFSYSAAHQQQVAVKRLDDIIGGDRLDLLKVDVEGLDYAVLRGARRTLEQNANCIIVYEHCAALFEPYYGSSAERLDEVLDMGFRLFNVDYDGAFKSVPRQTVLDDTDRLWNLVLRR